MKQSTSISLTDIMFNDVEKVVPKVDFSELEGKSIIITGASGLLGLHFLACIKKMNKLFNRPIIAYAIVQSEPEEFFIEEFVDKNIRLIRGDLTQIDFFQHLPQVDYIIHAAGYGQPRRFMENPIKTLQLSTTATLMLFEKLNKEGKFLFISTAEVYSGLENNNHKESEIGTTNTTHYRACYIEGKRSGETICNAYRSQGVNAKSARLALAYGPGTRKGDMRVINNFIEKGLQGEIALMDQGVAKRTYCYISDAIELMWNILLKGKEPIYNVGGNSKTTIANLAKQVGNMMDVPVIFPEGQNLALEGAPKEVSLDISLAEREFNKKEFISLKDGLKSTIQWQKLMYGN